jgi:hypothetical protein
MQVKLQNLFSQLENDKQELIALLKQQDKQKMNTAPDGKWTITQIVAHIIAVEKFSGMYINKKMLGMKDAQNTGIGAELMMSALKISQQLPLQFKAPKYLVDNTPVYADFGSMIANWDKTRSELKAILEKFDDTQIKKIVYKHFLAGRLNIQQALIFFREHFKHHRPQIDRLMN